MDHAETTPTPPLDTPASEVEAVQRLSAARDRLKNEIGKIIVGQDDVIDHLLISLLCGGHSLMVGVPGLGKTLMARSMAQALQMEFRRIQFTPDLMPSDITGTDIIEEDAETGRRKLEFFPGPIFTHFLLADEINRAPPKTQAALLQAMQELDVSVGRQTYHLTPPFFVVATQNPIEQEGTYPLPEAQLDRFMFQIPVTYPTSEEESQIVKNTTVNLEPRIEPLLSAEDIMQFRRLVRGVPVADAVVDYAVALARFSRPGSGVSANGLHRYIRYGASPRASQCLILCAKARAILHGKFHVDFEDVRAVAPPILRHRIVLNFHARADQMGIDDVLQRILKDVRPN